MKIVIIVRAGRELTLRSFASLRMTWKVLEGLLFVLIMSVVLTGCLPTSGSQKTEDTGQFVKGRAVRGFPGLPLYKNAQIIESYGDRGSWGAIAVSGDEVSKVLKFYDEFLPTLLWDYKIRQSGARYVVEVKNSQYEGEIIVNTAADGKKTAISAFVAVR